MPPVPAGEYKLHSERLDLASLSRPGGTDGVEGVALALAVPDLAVGAVDFDDPYPRRGYVEGQAGS